jgi:hypothetical protein
VYVAPFDVRLPKSNEEDDLVDTVVQPDVLIVIDRKKIDARGVRGAPDWVAEVLSPSTARHDQTVKLSAYERAGVREVWLIDPVALTLTIYQLEITGARPLSNSKDERGSLPFRASPLIGPACWPGCRKTDLRPTSAAPRRTHRRRDGRRCPQGRCPSRKITDQR